MWVWCCPCLMNTVKTCQTLCQNDLSSSLKSQELRLSYKTRCDPWKWIKTDNIRWGATFTQVNFSPVWMSYDLMPPGGQTGGDESHCWQHFFPGRGFTPQAQRPRLSLITPFIFQTLLGGSVRLEQKRKINGPCSDTEQTATASPQMSGSWWWSSLIVRFELFALNYGGKILFFTVLQNAGNKLHFWSKTVTANPELRERKGASAELHTAETHKFKTLNLSIKHVVALKLSFLFLCLLFLQCSDISYHNLVSPELVFAIFYFFLFIWRKVQ